MGFGAPGPRPRTLFAVAAAVYVALGLWYASRLRVSGDEPHYLLMARSLWREHDLDLRDNFLREDWRADTPGPVAPHWGAPRRDGRPFPAHSPGLPFLLAPIDAAGGRLLCVAALGLAAAALTLQVRALALRAGAAPAGALLAWAMAAGPPVAFYALHVYTEVPSALALAGALRLLLEARDEERGPSVKAGAAALLAVLLPWLHVKMAAAAVVIGVLAVAWLRGRPRLVFVAVATLGATLYGFFFFDVYGFVSPLALYGGSAPGVGERRPLLSLAGLLLDRSFGVLPYAPVFLLGLAGLPRLVARARRDQTALALVATGVAVLLPVLAWRMWWGGQCPPARFLVPLVPLLAVAAGAALPAEGPSGLFRLRWPLAAFGCALTLFMAADPGRLLMLNRGDRQTRIWTALSPASFDIGRLLPSLVAAEPGDLWVLAAWLVVLAGVFTWHAAAVRRGASPAR